MSVSKEVCHNCSKSVYPQERLSADAKIYHKACFRCKKCASVIKLGSYASMDGEVFCKNCFKKMFFTKGNYSDGFGKLKPQEQHDLKTGNKPVAINLSVFNGVNKVVSRANTMNKISRSTDNSDDKVNAEDNEQFEEDKKQARKIDTLNLDLSKKKQEEADQQRRSEKKKIEEEKKNEAAEKITVQRRSMRMTPQELTNELMEAERSMAEEENAKKQDKPHDKPKEKEINVTIDLEERKKKFDEDKLKSEEEKKRQAEEKKLAIMKEIGTTSSERKEQPVEQEKAVEDPEVKKKREAERIQKEKENAEKREKAENERVMKERNERKLIEDEQMKEDEVRRKKQLEETTFTSKADVKFSKPAPPKNVKRHTTAISSSPIQDD